MRYILLLLVAVGLTSNAYAEEPQFGKEYDLVEFSSSDWGSFTWKCGAIGISADAVVYQPAIFHENDKAKFEVFQNYCKETNNDGLSMKLTLQDYDKQLKKLRVDISKNPERFTKIFDAAHKSYMRELQQDSQSDICRSVCGDNTSYSLNTDNGLTCRCFYKEESK